MSEIFGFIEAADDLQQFIDNVDGIEQILDEEAEKIKNEAIAIARSKGLAKTGAGISGIQITKKIGKRMIGWGDRPHFHLYFYEIGTKKVAPRPHLRPAFDKYKESSVNRIKQKIESKR